MVKERFGRGLVLYYLGTPVFVLLDLLLPLSVRVPLPDGWSRGVYYAALLGLGLLCHQRSSLAPWIGMGESAFNLLLVLLSVLLPIWAAPEAILAGGEGPDPGMLMARVANLVLAGTVFVVGFHASRASLDRGRPAARQGTVL